MRVEVSKHEKGEEKVFKGEYSYMESWKEDHKFVSLMSIVKNETEGNFDIQFTLTEEELTKLIEQLNILKYQGGNSG